MKRGKELYGKIGPKKGDAVIESMAIESLVTSQTETRKRESMRSKPKLGRLKTTATKAAGSPLKLSEMHAAGAAQGKSGVFNQTEDGILEAPPSGKKRRLSMEVPSAKKHVGNGRQFGNKPLFEQFKRQNDYRLISQNLFNNMMENLDWDRAHTIEEVEEDSPEGILEEHRAREASNISKSDFNPYDEIGQVFEIAKSAKKAPKQIQGTSSDYLLCKNSSHKKGKPKDMNSYKLHSQGSKVFSGASIKPKPHADRFSVSDQKSTKLDKHLNLLIQIEQFSENLRH